jgi:hypothetical protein
MTGEGDSASFQCPFCFEMNEMTLEGEPPYRTILDCEVCCHPIEISVSLDYESGEVEIGAAKSSGFD